MQPANRTTWSRRGLSLAGLLFCLSVMIGCNTTAKNSAGELEAKSRTHIADIPVPIGFDLLEKRSRSYKNQTGLRWVDYLYEGHGDKFDVVRFYENQMITFHWDPQTTQTAQGQTSLDFTKEHERCRIMVSGGGALSSTYIHISITPGTNIGPPANTK